jgi:TNF receptor-associated factor 4
VKLLGQKIEVLQAIGAAHAPLATQFPQRPLHQQEPEPDYIWKIVNFTRKLAQAKSGNGDGMIQSEPFFTSHGYKMKLQVQLNAASSGYAGYMGVYLVLMKSDRDGTLPWPFTKRYTFVLVDQQDDLSQRQNIEKAFIPSGEEAFKRPTQRENRGGGRLQFVKHSTLRTRQYIRDHVVYIKILVEP